MSSKKSKTKFDKKAISTFIISFIIALVAMVPSRMWLASLSQKTVFNPVEGKVLEKDMEKVDVDPSSPFYDVFSTGERVNFLLLGLADGNTDTIMVASYDTKNQSVDIISIPRDTYYARSGYKSYAYNKINSVYRTDGIVGIATAASEILYGMPINYYVIVEYDDIRKIVDAVGGVYVDVPFRMKYDDPAADPPLHIDIPEGNVLITSDNVEQYLRFRHGNAGYKSYYNGDLGRIQTQQAFLKLLMKKCLQLDNITDVAKVVLQNVQSDITYTKAISLARSAMGGLSVDNVTTQRIPGNEATLHSLSFWMPNDTEVYNMLEEILIPKAESTTSEGATSGAAVAK